MSHSTHFDRSAFQRETALLPNTDVSCPFHKYIAPGTSTFTVSIPKPFLTYRSPSDDNYRSAVQKRKFSFSSLRLVPDFFSRDAQLFDLDTEEDLKVKTTNQFHLVHKVSPFLFNFAAGTDGLWEFETKSTNLEDNKIATFLDTVNKYTESAKPKRLVKAPFFLDWTTLDLDLLQEEDEESVQTDTNDYVKSFASFFYAKPDDLNAQFNKLQPSQRKVPLANNWAFPDRAYEDPKTLFQVRVRLAVAPNTKVLFSSKKMLELLGFKPEKRTLYKYEFTNQSSSAYTYFVADGPPTMGMYNYGKISAAPYSNLLVTPVQTIAMNFKDKRSNAALYKHVKTVLDRLADETNIDFNIEYNVANETFKFVFGDNPAIKTVVYCDNDLSYRLGYGLKREIGETDVSTPVQDMNIKESAKKARIISFDTGHVVVTCFNTSSNLTSVSNNQYMASLLADNAGMMTITTCRGEAPSFVPPNYEQDGNNNVPLLCNLLKFNDAGDLVPFQWKTGAFVSGVLQGKL
jgi:hypothetical protein